MRTLLFFACTLLASSMLYSQNMEFNKENIANNPEWKTALKSIKKGDKFFMKSPGSSKQSIPYYLDAYAVNPNSALLNFKMAQCYLESYEDYKALPYAMKAAELNPDVAPTMRVVLAQSYHKAGRFEEALSLYGASKSDLGKLPDYSEEWLDKRMDECRNGISLKAQTQYRLRNIGNPVNTRFSEYVPLVKADDNYMYYTSRMAPDTNSSKKQKISKFDFEPYESLYRANKENDTTFSAPTPVSLIKDAARRHEACVSLSPDGKTMFFYNGSAKNELKFSELKDGVWQASQTVEGVNTKYYESHISVSADNNRAFVVSDRKEGFGGKDIYLYTKNEDGSWGNPVNLGDKINTAYDEDGAFIHPDGKTLYFSSRGHNTMGGYDVFYSVLENGEWSVPVNLGPPVNTPGDDIYFVLSGSGDAGYLSSARPGGMGEQDIYQFGPIEEKKPDMTLFKGIVVDAKTRDTIEAKVVIVDNKNGVEIFNNRSDRKEGFLVSLPGGSNYGITVNADDYIFYSENIDLTNRKGYVEETKIIELSKIEVGATFVLNNVFFDFDKSTLKTESISELNRALEIFKRYPNVRIEIGGHTDSYGSNEYNERLSQARAEVVKRYLIDNGLAAVRITKVKGYGEEVPVQTNETPEGRAKNRRVEFKIVAK